MLFKVVAIFSFLAVAKAGFLGDSFGFTAGHLPAPAFRYGSHINTAPAISFAPPHPVVSFAAPAPLLLPRPAPLLIPRPAPLHFGGHLSAGFGFNLGAHIRPAPLLFSPLPAHPVPVGFGFNPILSSAHYNVGHSYANDFSHSSYGNNF